MANPGAVGPAPNSSAHDLFDSLFAPGGNPEALDRQAGQHQQLRDGLTQHAAELSTLMQTVFKDGGWYGRTADAFRQDGDYALKQLNALAHSHDLAAQGLTAQAEQKRHQQAMADMLRLTIVLALGSVALVALAPAAVGAETVLAAAASEGAEAAEGNALLRMLSQVGSRMAAAADLVATYVERLFGDALEGLAELVAKTGLMRSGWESMRMYALITILGRGSAKAGSEFLQNGAHWSDVLPALADGFDASKWTASDWANLLLITAVGPFVAVSPLAEAVAGLTLPAPLAAAVGLPAGVVAGPTLGAAVDGAFWNGGVTAVGAIGVNGEPADSPDVWRSTATSTALGGAAGMGAQSYTSWRGVTSETAGMDATTFWRTVIAFPADVGIAAGTAAPAPGSPAPVPEASEPPTAPHFQPKLVGGKKVTVQPGETLPEIAERDLGDANLGPALQQANPGPIQPGEEIVEPLLPERERPAS